MPRKIPKPVQQFRGTTAQHATYTGPEGEITVDTDKKVVVVQDGTTAGGISMAREDRKVAGDNYIKVNGAAKGTLAADLTLTMDMTKVAADLVSTDENNGLSVGTDNKLFAKAPDADLILRPGDKILHDVDGKVAADISVSYDQPSGVLNIIGHDGTTVVATATIPSSTSALKPTPWSPGDIKMWFGELDATGKYPLINGEANTSWHICDGTDGTPDMRDRVPVGASASKAKGASGGSETHGHTVSVTVGNHAAASITGSVASAYSGVSSSTASASISGTVASTTLSTSQMPSHSHKLEEQNGTIPSGSLGAYGVLIPNTSARSSHANGGSGSHTHGFSGSSHSHSISESSHTHGAGTLKTPALSHTASGDAADASTLQPYVALHFLMYVG